MADGSERVITSSRHPQVVHLRKLLSRPQLMRRDGLFVLDGVHLIEEALASPYQEATIFTSPRLGKHKRAANILARIEERGWDRREISNDLMDGLAPTDSPQGILGLFQRAHVLAGATPVPTHGLCGLILDGLQDPGNLGALARTARALGVERIVTTRGTVDPFHVRALRASSGALLHMDVRPEVTTPQLLADAREKHLALAALVHQGGIWPPIHPPDHDGFMLVLGSEGKGIGAELTQHCELRWTIPMVPTAESLGVAAAGAIALYAAQTRASPA